MVWSPPPSTHTFQSKVVLYTPIMINSRTFRKLFHCMPFGANLPQKESCSPGDLSYTSDRLLFASVGVSLLCCTVLLVDVIWRYRPGKARSPPRDWPEGPPPTTPAHHVPLEAFEAGTLPFSSLFMGFHSKTTP